MEVLASEDPALAAACALAQLWLPFSRLVQPLNGHAFSSCRKCTRPKTSPATLIGKPHDSLRAHSRPHSEDMVLPGDNTLLTIWPARNTVLPVGTPIPLLDTHSLRAMPYLDWQSQRRSHEALVIGKPGQC